jgi:hypothetical protein
MQHEEIINCPKSGGDLCYKVQVAPEIYQLHEFILWFLDKLIYD